MYMLRALSSASTACVSASAASSPVAAGVPETRSWLRPLFIARAAADNEVEVYHVSRTGDPGSRPDVTG